MKYQAKKNARGLWCVFQGRKYFLSTQTHTELKARQRALIMSMQWYENQKWLAWEELKKICEIDEHGDVKIFGEVDFSKMNDFLC